jgi:hypothetical protein
MCAAQVRIAACAALVAFVQSAGSSYCATNSGYLAAGVVLHMDDSDTQVAEAACQVCKYRGYMGYTPCNASIPQRLTRIHGVTAATQVV